jgi:hypothetical protein
MNSAPMGFHVYAKKFLDAEPTFSKKSHSPVPFYCVCRAIELALKSFLAAQGIPVKELRKKALGHDLQALLDKATAEGITKYYNFSSVEKAELEKANTYYADKSFEYFQIRFAMRNDPTLPNLDTLRAMARSLLESIHQLAQDAT